MLLSPNGGENWEAGVPDSILWTSKGVENVKIWYTTNNGATWLQLVPSTPSNGFYITSFSVPASEYKVKLEDADNGYPVAESNGVFEVNPQTHLSVLIPNGGERWE